MKVPYIQEHVDGLTLSIIVSPNAKRNAIGGEYNGRLKIFLMSPPVDGKANKALIRFLSDLFKCSKSSITIVRGELQREKDVSLSSVSLEDVKRVLPN